MITADTITDEQIRELHRISNYECEWDAVQWTLIALPSIGRPSSTSPAQYARLTYPSDHARRRSARARCAEILNARKQETP